MFTMGFKDILERIGEKNKIRKEKMRVLDENLRVQKIVEDRTKSANERELEKFMKEERGEQIKERLEFYRREREEDIKFNHNPINTKNIMKAEWEVMKEPNQFTGKSNMFSKNQFIHRDNPNLLKNNTKLCHI